MGLFYEYWIKLFCYHKKIVIIIIIIIVIIIIIFIIIGWLSTEWNNWTDRSTLSILEKKHLSLLCVAACHFGLPWRGVSKHAVMFWVSTLGGWYGKPTQATQVCSKGRPCRVHWIVGRQLQESGLSFERQRLGISVIFIWVSKSNLALSRFLVLRVSKKKMADQTFGHSIKTTQDHYVVKKLFIVVKCDNMLCYYLS